MLIDIHKAVDIVNDLFILTVLGIVITIPVALIQIALISRKLDDKFKNAEKLLDDLGKEGFIHTKLAELAELDKNISESFKKMEWVEHIQLVAALLPLLSFISTYLTGRNEPSLNFFNGFWFCLNIAIWIYRRQRAQDKIDTSKKVNEAWERVDETMELNHQLLTSYLELKKAHE